MNRITIGGIAASAPQLIAWPGCGKALGLLAAAALCVATIAQPTIAQARYGGGGGGGGHGGGGGGFHGGGFGGFHGGGFGGLQGGGFGGFQGGGFHRDAPSGAGMDEFHDGGFRGGSDTGSVVLRGGHGDEDRRDGRFRGWDYNPYLWSDDSLYGDYDANGGQAYAAQYWYYCSDPVGYYPYVTQCSLPWQTVPAG